MGSIYAYLSYSRQIIIQNLMIILSLSIIVE